MRTAPYKLPVGWTWAILQDVADIVGGLTKGQKLKAGAETRAVPYLRVANVQRGYLDLTEVKIIEATEQDIQALRLQQGDILFNEGGDRDKLGRGWIWDSQLPECIHQNHVFRARLVLPEIAPRLISWWGNSFGQKWFMDAGKQSVNLASINLSNLRDFPIPIAPAAEQARIIDALDELLSDLDIGVEALQRAQAKLKQYRATVIKSAVEGRLTAEWRKRNAVTESGSELLERILAERRRLWEEGQLRKFTEKGKEPPRGWQNNYPGTISANSAKLPPLPKEWVWVTWSQIGFSQNGRAFPSSDYKAQGVKLLRPGNLYFNGKTGWNSRNTKFLPLHYAKEFPELIVKGRELVMNLTAQSLKDEFLGRVCLTASDEYCLLNQRLARLTPILSSPKYLLWSFKSPYFREFVNGLNAGSLIQHIFTSQIESAAIPLPPLPEQQAIVEALEEQINVIDHLEALIEKKFEAAQLLQQAILSRAFTGQLIPQDPNDESAVEILKRIAAERTQRSNSISKRRSRIT
jgi:type I restriction enzyme S subunit